MRALQTPLLLNQTSSTSTKQIYVNSSQSIHSNLHDKLNHVWHHQARRSSRTRCQPASSSKSHPLIRLSVTLTKLIVIRRPIRKPPRPKTWLHGWGCQSPPSEHPRTNATIWIPRKDVEQVRPVLGFLPTYHNIISAGHAVTTIRDQLLARRNLPFRDRVLALLVERRGDILGGELLDRFCLVDHAFKRMEIKIRNWHHPLLDKTASVCSA